MTPEESDFEMARTSNNEPRVWICRHPFFGCYNDFLGLISYVPNELTTMPHNNLSVPYIVSTIVVFASHLRQSNAYLTSTPARSEDIIHCGSSIEEARALGCHFDIMSYAYYPDACWDPHLHDHFVTKYRKDWEWMTLDYQPLTVDEVLTGNYSHLRARSDFHQLHCVYEWQRLLRSMAFQRPLDFKDGDFGHAHHCSGGLLQTETKDVSQGGPTHLKLIVWFANCGMTKEQMERKGNFGHL